MRRYGQEQRQNCRDENLFLLLAIPGTRLSAMACRCEAQTLWLRLPARLYLSTALHSMALDTRL